MATEEKGPLGLYLIGINELLDINLVNVETLSKTLDNLHSQIIKVENFEELKKFIMVYHGFTGSMIPWVKYCEELIEKTCAKIATNEDIIEAYHEREQLKEVGDYVEKIQLKLANIKSTRGDIKSWMKNQRRKFITDVTKAESLLMIDMKIMDEHESNFFSLVDQQLERIKEMTGIMSMKKPTKEQMKSFEGLLDKFITDKSKVKSEFDAIVEIHKRHNISFELDESDAGMPVLLKVYHRDIKEIEKANSNIEEANKNLDSVVVFGITNSTTSRLEEYKKHRTMHSKITDAALEIVESMVHLLDKIAGYNKESDSQVDANKFSVGCLLTVKDMLKKSHTSDETTFTGVSGNQPQNLLQTIESQLKLHGNYDAEKCKNIYGSELVNIEAYTKQAIEAQAGA